MSDTVEQDVQEAPAEDIRSSIRAAYEAQQEARQPAEKPEVVEKPEAKAEEPETKPERARGPDGKFVAKDAVEEAQPKAETAKPEATEKPAAEIKPEESAGKEPPAAWLAADKEMFKTLPPGAQEFLLRRHSAMEADYTRKTQQVAELRRDFEPVAQIFAPHRERMAQAGLTPHSLVQAWANVEQRLMNGDGVNVIRSLVDGYKIPREQIASALGIRAPATTAGGDQQPPAPDAPQPAIPPQLLSEIQAQRAWIENEQRRQQYDAQMRQYEAANRIENDINSFRTATDSAGQLLHPHYADVEHDMAALVHAYRASGKPVPPLSELYEAAVWSNPSTRALMQQQQTAALEAQRQQAAERERQEARAKAERARRAGASVTGAPGGAPQNNSARRDDGTIRGAIRAAMEEYAA